LEELPKGFEELPRTDPQYQGVQGFSFENFPPLGGEVTSNVTKGAPEAPLEDVESDKQLVDETDEADRTAQATKGKAKESILLTPDPVALAESPAAEEKQEALPSRRSSIPFDARDMASGEGSSIKRRSTPVKGKDVSMEMVSDPLESWSEERKAIYRGTGLQMVIEGPVVPSIKALCPRIWESEEFGKEVEKPEQALVNYLFRGSYTQGLDSQYYMRSRLLTPELYPTWISVLTNKGHKWSPHEKRERHDRQMAKPTQQQFESLTQGVDPGRTTDVCPWPSGHSVAGLHSYRWIPRWLSTGPRQPFRITRLRRRTG